MPEVRLVVNGEEHAVDAPVGTSLAAVLREHLGLTGTKIACNEGHCGACTVQVDGVPRLSCITLAHAVDGEVTTIEGLAPGDELHPVQQAFHEHHGLQCGFCTPGMVMSAIDFAKNRPGASEKEVREALEGNLCRCTGYHNIVKAIMAGSKAMAAAK